MNDNSTIRSVFITGGTGSIGRELVYSFVDAGFAVSFGYCTHAQRAEDIHRATGATYVKLDLTSDDACDFPWDYDVLVNNAGINISRERIAEVDDRAMMATFLVNWVGPFRLCKRALPYMSERNFGRIININSIYGIVSSVANGPYTSSKFALTALTRTIAREYGGLGITCNQICPGAVESELLSRIANYVYQRDGIDQEAYFAMVRESIPSGRMAKPKEIGDLAVFLASDRAGHINGASIPVDGGSIA